jgi:ABC-type transport system involved in multi-copper enzyme maturation permease subunit
MSTVVAGGIGAQSVAGIGRPSFWGLMRGEWLKLSRMWALWIMVSLMFGGFILVGLLFDQTNHLANTVADAPVRALATVVETPLFLIRVFWGMMVIILTARLIGAEYSSGAVRVILARGVGRLQLLFAKLSVIALVAVVGAVIFAVFAGALELIDLRLATGSLDVFKYATASFWTDARSYALSVLVSLGVSILMATTVTSLARSLAVGVTASVLWFPIDNFVRILFALAIRLTKWSFWSLLSGDFLGPNLNAMANLVTSGHMPDVLGFGQFLTPITPVTGGHTLLVAAIYALVFLAVTLWVTATRDVRE